MPVIPVAVVVPAYNPDARLVRALDSVDAQRLKPAEVVLVDDGSTGGDVGDALARRAPGVGVRLLRMAHGGPSRARNRGIAATRQPWIAFLDADDTWEPEKLLRQWEVVCTQPDDLTFVSCDWLRPAAPSRRLPRSPSPRLPFDPLQRFLWLNRCQTSTVLARRDAVLRAGGFRPELDGAEDWDLWLRLCALGRWAHLPQALVRYADSAGGVSKDLLRLYEATGRMLDGYRDGQGWPQIARLVRPRVVLWHHLRFAWAFRRLGDRTAARRCVRAAWRPGCRLPAAGVALTALLPFLIGRVCRRLTP